MISPTSLHSPLLAQQALCSRQRRRLTILSVAVISACLAILYADTRLVRIHQLSIEILTISTFGVGSLFLAFGFQYWRYWASKARLNAYHDIRQQLELCLGSNSPHFIQRVKSDAGAKARGNHLVAPLLEHYEPMLRSRLIALHKSALKRKLGGELQLAQRECSLRVDRCLRQIPLIEAKLHLEASIAFLTARRREMQQQWDLAYSGFGWWNKLKFCMGPDFSEIEEAIGELEHLQRQMAKEHAADFARIEKYVERLKLRAVSRLAESRAQAKKFIEEGRYSEAEDASMLDKALWFSAMSIPVSVWADFNRAGDIYDALRGVNGNFADLSNAEIWWDSLLMPTESLAGLAALTKGAYFEQLVAADTGGELHEHFNQPDTDIVIDGIAFQLKATDSTTYIETIDPDIPVIATSEVAMEAGVIDSGYSNEELTQTISDALGGDLLDLGDTTVDAVLAGVGGLGLFASVQGINHATRKYKDGGDGVVAMFEGAGVAIEGTARGIVGAAELSYKALTSSPSRFVGRLGLKMVGWPDSAKTAEQEKR